MSKLIVLVPLVSVGCLTSKLTLHNTPLSVDPTVEHTLPYNVDFELLGVGKGKACGQLGDLGVLRSAARDYTGPAHPILYQQAKYAAIESVAEADNLMFIRLRSETQGSEQCVEVTGRAYRVREVTTFDPGERSARVAEVSPVRAAPPAARPEPPPAPAPTEEGAAGAPQ